MDLKREMLKLLDEDEEFRYAVAGRIGILEILRRLDKLEEGQNKLWDGQNKLWEAQNKLWEGQNKLWEEVRNLREDQKKLWENQYKLWENQNKLWEEVRNLREDQKKLWENQNKLWEEVRDMRITLNRVSATLERLTISVEEEALSFIKHRLKADLGLDVELDRVFVDSKEINIYGAVDDLCVVGETAVRLGSGLVDELLAKIELIKTRKPELLRRRIIKAIYTDYATPDSLKRAAQNNVWVLKWSGDLTPLKIEQT